MYITLVFFAFFNFLFGLILFFNRKLRNDIGTNGGGNLIATIGLKLVLGVVVACIGYTSCIFFVSILPEKMVTEKIPIYKLDQNSKEYFVGTKKIGKNLEYYYLAKEKNELVLKSVKSNEASIEVIWTEQVPYLEINQPEIKNQFLKGEFNSNLLLIKKKETIKFYIPKNGLNQNVDESTLPKVKK